MSLIDHIESEMRNDDEDRVKQSRRLIADYRAATDAEKRAIDGALICICGWSLPTLIEQAGDSAEFDCSECHDEANADNPCYGCGVGVEAAEEHTS